MTRSLRQLSLAGNPLGVPIKTSAGPGGDAVWMNTPQTETAQAREFVAKGYGATRIAPTPFVSYYRGGLLKGGLLKVDFKA